MPKGKDTILVMRLTAFFLDLWRTCWKTSWHSGVEQMSVWYCNFDFNTEIKSWRLIHTGCVFFGYLSNVCLTYDMLLFWLIEHTQAVWQLTLYFHSSSPFSSFCMHSDCVLRVSDVHAVLSLNISCVDIQGDWSCSCYPVNMLLRCSQCGQLVGVKKNSSELKLKTIN